MIYVIVMMGMIGYTVYYRLLLDGIEQSTTQQSWFSQ